MSKIAHFVAEDYIVGQPWKSRSGSYVSAVDPLPSVGTSQLLRAGPWTRRFRAFVDGDYGANPAYVPQPINMLASPLVDLRGGAVRTFEVCLNHPPIVGSTIGVEFDDPNNPNDYIGFLFQGGDGVNTGLGQVYGGDGTNNDVSTTGPIAIDTTRPYHAVFDLQASGINPRGRGYVNGVQIFDFILSGLDVSAWPLTLSPFFGGVFGTPGVTIIEFVVHDRIFTAAELLLRSTPYRAIP